MLSHFLSRQFLAFLAVGVTAALLHWLARIGLSLFLPYSWAVCCAYAVGMAIAFTLNRVFVFPASGKAVTRQVRDFMLVNLAFFPVVWAAALALNQLLLGAGVAHYSEEIAHALAISLPVLATFLLYKFYAFREKGYG